jgi:hypothetical protein
MANRSAFRAGLALVGVAAVGTAPVIRRQRFVNTPACAAEAALKLLMQQADDDPDPDRLKELPVEIECHYLMSRSIRMC